MQTVTSSTHAPKTDAADGKSPLYDDKDTHAHFYDRPSTTGSNYGANFVTIVGTADPKNHPFHAKEAMSWGYNVDGQGNVRGIAPHVANQGQVRGALEVVKHEYPAWKID